MEYQKNMILSPESVIEDDEGRSATQRLGIEKWRKSKSTGLSIFIAKTFEILEVTSVFYLEQTIC